MTQVFVTGSTGVVGTAVVQCLISHGYRVLGLARSRESADKLQRAGAQALLGSLEDFATLKSGCKQSDAVIHLAFNHDFTKFAESGRLEQQVLGVFADALRDSKRPFIATSGVALVAPGRVAKESDRRSTGNHMPRDAETPTLAMADNGVRAMLVRLAVSTHGDAKGGFAGIVADIARAKQASAYVADGENLWPAVHRADAAELYRLALEKGDAGTIYHAVDEQGIPMKQIATTIGDALGVHTKSVTGADTESHFGGFGAFAAIDAPAEATATRHALGWQPTHMGLLDDLRANLTR